MVLVKASGKTDARELEHSEGLRGAGSPPRTHNKFC